MSEDVSSFSLAGAWAPAPADFQDADETRPSGAHMEALGGNQDAIQGIVQLTLGRHITEAVPPRTSPQLTSFSMNTGNWRKRLREMMIRQNETVLGFLYKPAAEHSVIGPVEQALRRYALRQDVDTGAVKTLKNMITDMSGNQQAQIDSEIEEAVLKKGTSNLSQVRSQVNAMVELYKETGEKLLDSENQLKLRLEKMDKIQKRVSVIIEMQTNEAMPELVASLEKYLKVSFREMGIEPYYKELIYLYQKHITLREAIQVFKTASQASEPTCPICLSEAIGMAIVPCGHTFCHTCGKRMVTECGVCRGRIHNRQKLFIN